MIIIYYMVRAYDEAQTLIYTEEQKLNPGLGLHGQFFGSAV